MRRDSEVIVLGERLVIFGVLSLGVLFSFFIIGMMLGERTERAHNNPYYGCTEMSKSRTQQLVGDTLRIQDTFIHLHCQKRVRF